MYSPVGIEVKDLVLVQAIMEQGTLSAAARHLGLSQPALSRQLADAERRLECLLFVRQGRRLQLAPAGQRLLALAQTALPSLAQAERELRASGLPSEDEVLRIVATTPQAYPWLLPALRAHADKHGFVAFQLELPGQGDAVQLLRAAQAEAVVSPTAGLAPELKAVPLFREELFVYLSPKHPAARQAFFPPGAFESVDLLTEAPLSDTPALAHLLRLQGLRPKRVNTVSLTEAVLALALHGQGVACLFRRAAQSSPLKAQLSELRLTARGCFVTWRALILQSRAELLLPKLQELAAVCAA